MPNRWVWIICILALALCILIGTSGIWRTAPVPSPGLSDERDAILIVQNTHPELKAYPSDQFPTKSIKTEKAPDGWYVAFIQEGSGVPIISAQCYYVGNDKNIRPTGLVNHSIMVQSEVFSAQKCG